MALNFKIERYDKHSFKIIKQGNDSKEVAYQKLLLVMFLNQRKEERQLKLRCSLKAFKIYTLKKKSHVQVEIQ